jgi:chemotaxis protein MotB
MSDAKEQPIIVKRIKKGGGGHHGGAWKIAYADFVTAMMAFFLLMWLLGSTTKGDLKGIADYFKTPLKVAMQGGSGSGRQFQRDQGRRRGPHAQRSGRSSAARSSRAKKTSTCKAAQAELERASSAKLKQLKRRVEQAIDANPTLRQFKRSC